MASTISGELGAFDRGIARVRYPLNPGDRIAANAPPLHRALEDPLKNPEAAVDGWRAGARGDEGSSVSVDRLPADLAHSELPEVRDDPLVDRMHVARERRR